MPVSVCHKRQRRVNNVRAAGHYDTQGQPGSVSPIPFLLRPTHQSTAYRSQTTDHRAGPTAGSSSSYRGWRSSQPARHRCSCLCLGQPAGGWAASTSRRSEMN